MIKEVLLLRTRPIELSAWRPIYYGLVPLNSVLCGIVMGAVFFLQGQCYLSALRPGRYGMRLEDFISIYLRKTPLVPYCLAVLAGYLALFVVGSWISNEPFGRVVKRLILRTLPLLAMLPVALWYTDIPYSGQFICNTFHDRGIRSYSLVAPVALYAGVSLLIGLWNLRRPRASAAPDQAPG